MLLAVYTEKTVATDDLPNIVCCNYNAACATAACSCGKHGVVCSVGCSNCRGQPCFNLINLTNFEGLDSE